MGSGFQWYVPVEPQALGNGRTPGTVCGWGGVGGKEKKE